MFPWLSIENIFSQLHGNCNSCVASQEIGELKFGHWLITNKYFGCRKRGKEKKRKKGEEPVRISGLNTIRGRSTIGQRSIARVNDHSWTRKTLREPKFEKRDWKINFLSTFSVPTKFPQSFPNAREIFEANLQQSKKELKKKYIPSQGKWRSRPRVSLRDRRQRRRLWHEERQDCTFARQVQLGQNDPGSVVSRYIDENTPPTPTTHWGIDSVRLRRRRRRGSSIAHPHLPLARYNRHFDHHYRFLCSTNNSTQSNWIPLCYLPQS